MDKRINKGIQVGRERGFLRTGKISSPLASLVVVRVVRFRWEIIKCKKNNSKE